MGFGVCRQSSKIAVTQLFFTLGALPINPTAQEPILGILSAKSSAFQTAAKKKGNVAITCRENSKYFNNDDSSFNIVNNFSSVDERAEILAWFSTGTLDAA